MAEERREASRRMTIIVSKGALDAAYPPFILATMGAAMGVEVTMFFTFYGLFLLRRKLDASVSALGNPAFRLPIGGRGLRLPNLLSALPGVEEEISDHLRRRFAKTRVADLSDLRALTVEAGARLIACQMTMDLFDLKPADLIDGVTLGGAATYLEDSLSADVNLFV
ncbi:MAG: DsrE/DsrF/DrsH-like family protein [Hyphomicrobiales bacterium]|nr:DsrE/DsrF/DrsH-like family protein [Hyphomicrobiales bacterium]